MGFSISWIAFPVDTRVAALQRLSLVDTGDSDEANESPISGATLPTGWYIAFFNDYEFAARDKLAELSSDCVVLACQIEEHVMASAAHCYDFGKLLWSVAHDSSNGIFHLDVDGRPPEQLAEIRRHLLEEQQLAGGAKADVDFIFDVPVELAATLSGFRHDRSEFDWGRPAFTRLQPLKQAGQDNPPRKRWGWPFGR